MNLYYAIIAAAEQIEKHPGSFKFTTTSVPEDDCGSPGCALGWVAHFAGYEDLHADYIDGYSQVGRFARDFMKVPVERNQRNAEMSFYGRMDRLESADAPQPWIDDPVVAAQTLRKYAQMYHGHEKLRPTSELVADLMAKVTGEKIPEDA